ncbi:MAG TPA: hypothetical protein VMB73_36320 [Acetobacteraceae bacterium]|nr:hypothetical protein [Acetobacteraceae bacterium]
MGDLAVRQPHLGRETKTLLGRIVDSEDGGVPQDNIEPYLLVRLLRCGYVRRREPESPFFVATPAGVERSRMENLLAKRRQDEFARREIIRGRVQTMLDRLELDRAPEPAPPALRDLPLYRERPLRFLREPPRPATPTHALTAPKLANRVQSGMRDTPADVLRAIREAEIRARRALPVPEANEPLTAPAAGAVVVHLGRLPEPRSVAAREPPVTPPPGEALPPVVVVEVIDLWRDAGTRHGAGLPFEDAADRTAPWSRTALAATVAAAVLLIADPRYRPEVPAVERPARVSLALAQAAAPRHSPPAPPIVLSADTKTAKQPHATAARAATHSMDTRAPTVAQSVALQDQPHPVSVQAATVPSHVATAAASPRAATPPIITPLVAGTAEPAAAPTQPIASTSTAAATSQRASTPPSITPVVAAAATSSPSPTPTVASKSTAATVSQHADTPRTITPVVAATVKPGPAPTLTVASTSSAAAPSPKPPAPTMRPAPVHAATTQEVALSSAPVTPAAREPGQVATAPVEAMPPLIPPPPPPNLVATVALHVTEPSGPADPAPPDDVPAHRPDHARAAVHFEHKPAVAGADVDGRGRVLAEADASPDTHAISRGDALTRVTAGLPAGEESDNVMVDRLNTLSLEAARHNRVFIPPGVARRVIAPKRPRALALP